MKIETLIATSVVVLLVVPFVKAQGTFQNLNFEQANPVSAGDPDNPSLVTATSAVPHWSVYYNGVQQTQVEYNTISAGGTQLTLVSASNPYEPAISGKYSVILQSYDPTAVVSINQTGLIPAGTQSLLFEGAGGELGYLTVQIGSQTVSFSAIGSGPNYTLYGTNISEWANDTELLTFSGFGGNPNAWEIDNISFSLNAVPEPSIVVLTAMGGLLFGARKWFARR